MGNICPSPQPSNSHNICDMQYDTNNTNNTNKTNNIRLEGNCWNQYRKPFIVKSESNTLFDINDISDYNETQQNSNFDHHINKNKYKSLYHID